MIRQKLAINEAAIAIRDYIDANPLSKETPSGLAEKFEANRYKVLPVFKKLTGDTIKHYQLKKCMEAAAAMLLSGKAIKEVAIECGYPDYHNNFTRSFKKVFITGPEEWVKKNLVERTVSTGQGKLSG